MEIKTIVRRKASIMSIDPGRVVVHGFKYFIRCKDQYTDDESVVLVGMSDGEMVNINRSNIVEVVDGYFQEQMI